MRDAIARRRRSVARIRLRHGVYLFPSLLTTANIFCGFTAITMTFEGEYRIAAILIIVAGFLDGLDGRIARMMGRVSEFGGEFDSLADVVSFGLAPAFLVQVWGLAPLNRYGWGIAFIYLVCGAIRLARFNIQHGATDRRWFVGLPIPMAAAALAGCVLVLDARIATPTSSLVFAGAVLATALLMVSRFRYRSFKDIDLRSRRPFRSILLIVVIFGIIAMDYKLACLLIAGGYVASGPLLSAFLMLRGPRRREQIGPQTGGGTAPAAAEGRSHGDPSGRSASEASSPGAAEPQREVPYRA